MKDKHDIAQQTLLRYCPDLYAYRRRKTRVVMVGSIGVGGEHPIRLQSMTTTDTMDTEATVAQVIRMVDAGCEIVRITAPALEDAKNLKSIKTALAARGVFVPLVADIHFRPDAAMEAADHVEKVRINPGNYTDSKQFKVKEYTDVEYIKELERIEERFVPLVLKLKKLGKALRIGTNHGSLSDRIMSRYGDTPLGMVESALEFVRICRKHDYHNIILSMKASNPKVMIAAYRLLAARMQETGMDYPFHLGVTEAGGGEDGRIKSAIGIGSLLEDGIGDTIRVSLTEDPEFEIPVARSLASRYLPKEEPASLLHPEASYTDDLFGYKRRETGTLRAGQILLGSGHPIRFVSSFSEKFRTPAALQQFVKSMEETPPYELPEILEWPVYNDKDLADLLALKADMNELSSRIALLVKIPLNRKELWRSAQHADMVCPEGQADDVHWIELLTQISSIPILLERPCTEDVLHALELCETAGHRQLILGLTGSDVSLLIKSARALTATLKQKGQQYPLHIHAPQQQNSEELRIAASILTGSLLCDGIGDSVQIGNGADPARDLGLMINVLQGAGARISKTEYVSCPSCGRTLFDLQSTTERIQSKTGHLKGVKIAIMGCIVNGPGEMADADFGYVGGAPGRINLYVGKTCVEKNVPSDIADQRLIELIKSHGKWQAPRSY